MLTRPQPHEAEAEAEATTHEAEAEAEAEAKTHLEILVISIYLTLITKTLVKNSAVSVLPWPALPARYDVIINRKTLFRGASRRQHSLKY